MELKENQRYTVVINRRGVCQYACKESAENHASEVGGIVEVRKHYPKVASFTSDRGMNQSRCSKRMTKRIESEMKESELACFNPDGSEKQTRGGFEVCN